MAEIMGERIKGAPRRLSIWEMWALSIYWIAIGYLWNTMGSIIIPYLIQLIIGSKGSVVAFGPISFYIGRGLALAVLEGIGTLMAVVWQPVMGAVSDRTKSRFGRRHPYIFIGTLGDVVFLIGLALSGTYFWLFVFYFLLQAASNTAQGPYQGLLPDVVPDDQRGRASGYYGLANLLGTAVGTLVIGILIGKGMFGAAIASICVFLIVSMLITVKYVPDTTRATKEQVGPIRTLINTFSVNPSKHKDFLWLLVSRLLVLMGIVGLQSFAYFYIKDVFFPTPAHASSAVRTHLANIAGSTDSRLLLLVLVFSLIITLPAGRISERYGRKAIIIASSILGAISTGLLVFTKANWLPPALTSTLDSLLGLPEGALQILLVGILLGLGIGAFLSVDWAFATDLIPKEEAGKFMGLSNIATAGSGVIVRFIGGIIIDAYNTVHILGLPGGYPVLFAVFLVFFLVGSIVLIWVRDPKAPKYSKQLAVGC